MAIELIGAEQEPVKLIGTLRTSSAIALEDFSGVWAWNDGSIIGWGYDGPFKLHGTTEPEIKMTGTMT